MGTQSGAAGERTERIWESGFKAGETKTVTVRLNRRAFSYYDVKKKEWAAEPGEFGILVGSSSAKTE